VELLAEICASCTFLSLTSLSKRTPPAWASHYLFRIASMSVYVDPMPEVDLEVDFEFEVPNHPATEDNMSGGHGAEPKGSLNDRNLGRLTFNNPRSGMEIDNDPIDGSSGQLYANRNLRPSPFDCTSQGSSQPYNHDGSTLPYTQRHPRPLVHPQNQSRIFSTAQVETDCAAQYADWPNDDKVPEQASQHQVLSMWQPSAPSNIHATHLRHVRQPPRLDQSFAGNSISLEQKMYRAMYDEDSDFSQVHYYLPLTQQADPGQLSQRGMQALGSDAPWSTQNQRTNRPLLKQDLTTTQTQDWIAARDSTGYTSVQLDSQTFSNMSSDWDHSTTESSVVPPVEMSNSTATLRPPPYMGGTVNVEDEVSMSNTQTQPSKNRASSTTSLSSHIRNNPNFQGFPVQNGSDGFLSDIGTHSE
jgi:hypothetical protein